MFHKKLLRRSKQFLENAKKTLKSHPKEKADTKKYLNSYFEEQKQKQTVVAELSFASALKIIGTLVLLYVGFIFIAKVSDILISFFVSVFFAAALYPSVHYFEKKHIPRIFSIMLVFFLVFLFFVFLISSILPALIEQGIALGNWFIAHMQAVFKGDFSLLPSFVQQFGPLLQDSLKGLDEYLRNLENNAETQQGLFQFLTDNISRFVSLQGNITDFVTGFFEFLVDAVLVIVLSFFLLFEREQIITFVTHFFPADLRSYMMLKGEAMQNKISEWVHGQMILFLLMGTLTWLVLSILGVPYAMTIGFFAGLAEFIPFVGPLITFLIAAPLAFGQGVEVGLAVMVFFAILQFLEGNVFIPLIMKRAVGVSALITILAMLIGFQFLGIIGAIMSIPLASIIGLFLEDFQKKD